LDDRRSRSWNGGRSDQDRIGEPHRSGLQIQSVAADRRSVGRVREVRGEIRCPLRSRVETQRPQRPNREPQRSQRIRAAMKTLVLLRHGESTWNRENRFTGWTDVDLSERGLAEAAEAGRLLRDGGYTFDIAFTSVLKRAIRTLWIALDALDLMWIPIKKNWRL